MYVVFLLNLRCGPLLYRLWSLYHYRTLLVLYLQIHAHFLFVDILRRGRLFNCYARLLGASVGRDADVATMYFTDHDLVRNHDNDNHDILYFTCLRGGGRFIFVVPFLQ